MGSYQNIASLIVESIELGLEAGPSGNRLV